MNQFSKRWEGPLPEPLVEVPEGAPVKKGFGGPIIGHVANPRALEDGSVVADLVFSEKGKALFSMDQAEIVIRGPYCGGPTPQAI